MSRIESTGRYMPDNIVNNNFFTGESLFGPIDEFLTGYNERRHSLEADTGLVMASKAAKNALSKSSHSAEDIDLIIGCIVPNHNLYGEDLNLIQYEIGAKNASIMPINTTCSTFISALNVADSHISSGKKQCVLIIASVEWTKYGFDTEEPGYLFAGDGAAAVIVDNKSDSLIDVYEFNNSKPAVFQSMTMKNPVITGKKEYFKIIEPEGISTAKDLVMAPIGVAKTLLDRNPDIQVDKILMHQSGLKMMHMWVEKLGISFDKVCHTLDLFANMSLSSIPVSLDYWEENKVICRGDTLLLFAPATGGHYISMLWKY